MTDKNSPPLLPPTLQPAPLRKAVHKGLREWGQATANPTHPLWQLRLARQAMKRIDHPGGVGIRLAINQTLRHGLTLLAQSNSDGAKILELRFIEQEIAQAVANDFGKSIHTVRHMARHAIKELAAIIGEQEAELRRQLIRQKLEELPAFPTAPLVGREGEIESLTNHLLDDQAAGILVLSGLGGVGKTAVALETARQLIYSFAFERIIWLPLASPPEGEAGGSLLLTQLLEQLRQKVAGIDATAPPSEQITEAAAAFQKESACLFIDNLEGEETLATLIARLQPMASAGKIIITARNAPAHLEQVAVQTLGELSLEAAMQLVRRSAEMRNLPDIAAAPPERLAQIVEATGGNPLAIEITIGQAHYLPLPAILNKLHAAGNDIHQAIFEAVWGALSDMCQKTLLGMLLSSPSQTRPEFLATVLGKEVDSLWRHLNELRARCLIESSGDSWGRAYSIHRLTERFLLVRVEEPGENRAAFSRFVANALHAWEGKISQEGIAKARLMVEQEELIYRAIHFGLRDEAHQLQAARLLISLVQLLEIGYKPQESWTALFATAVERIQEPLLSTQLLNKWGVCYRAMGQLDEAVAIHRQAVAQATERQQPLELGRCLANLSGDYWRQGNYEAAEQNALEAIRCFGALPETPTIDQGVSCNILGVIFMKRGENEQAIKQFQQAINWWSQANHPIFLARAYNNLAIVQQNVEDFPAALDSYDCAEPLLIEIGNDYDLQLLHINRGTTYSRMRNWKETEKAYRQVDLPYLQQSGKTRAAAAAMTSLGYTLLQLQQPFRANAQLEEAVDVWRKVGDKVNLGNALKSLGEARCMLGDEAGAGRAFEEAKQLLESCPEDSWGQKLLIDVEKRYADVAHCRQNEGTLRSTLT